MPPGGWDSRERPYGYGKHDAVSGVARSSGMNGAASTSHPLVSGPGVTFGLSRRCGPQTTQFDNMWRATWRGLAALAA